MIIVYLCLALTARAYVPELSTLAQRAAEQHGRGVYQIEQEVTLKTGAETYTVKETWLTLGEGEQRVTLEGRGTLKGLVSGTALYTSGARYFAEAGQPVRGQRLGENWLEPLFLFRSSRWFRSRLVGLHITGGEALKDRPSLPTEGDLNYEPSPFVRLSRAGGDVAWAIGATPATEKAQPATLWLEQDQFVVRKLRASDQSAMRADEYSKFEDNLWFPRVRTYAFGASVVTAQVLSVRSLGKSSAADARFKSTSINPRDTWRPPDVEGLREFYARFR